MLKNARNIAVDPVRNLVAVSSKAGVLIFNRTDNGNVKPRATIKGLGGKFRLIQSKGWLVGTRAGGGDEDAPTSGGIDVWSITDNGNVPPLYLLSNPNGKIVGADIALNPNNKEVIVGGRLAVEIYSFPEVF